MAVADWAIPDATRVLPPTAPRDQWLAARRAGIGGSDVPAIMECHPWSGPLTVWRTKRGLRVDTVDQTSAPIWFGHKFEPIVAERFGMMTNLDYRTGALYRSTEHPWMMATPDFLTSDGGGLEIKTTSHHMADWWADGNTPDHVELQAHWYMMVTGRSPWYIACLIDTHRLELRTIERNPPLEVALHDRIRRFWVECVQGGDEPRASAGDADTVYIGFTPDPDRHTIAPGAKPLLAAYQAALAEKKTATRRVDDLKTQILATLKDSATLGPDDTTVWCTSRQTAPSVDKLLEVRPDLAERYLTTMSRRAVKSSLATDYPDVAAATSGRKLQITTGDLASHNVVGPAAIPSQRGVTTRIDQD